MSLRLPRTAPVAGPLLAAGLVLTLTACGANFEAQTYASRNNADSTNAAAGAVAVRNIRLLPPESGQVHEAGDDVDVELTLVNDGAEDDRLVEVTTPAARTVELLLEGDEVDALDVPRLGTTGSRSSLRLVAIADDLRPGEFVEVTLRFERNGEVTFPVPVATTGEYDEDRERSENFHEIGVEHGGEEESEGEEGLSGAGEATSEEQ